MAWGIGLMVAIILGLIGLLILIMEPENVFIVIPFILLAFSTPFYAPHFLMGVLVKRKGILTKMEGAKKDPLVRDMALSGWSLNHPTPR